MKIKIIKSSEKSAYKSLNISGNSQQINFVLWNPKAGVETTEGYTMSPSTVLEHEVAHAVMDATDRANHLKMVNTYDAQFDNKGESVIITGTEARTAISNGEFPKGYSRSNHRGRKIETPYVTSNKKKRYLNFE